MNLDFFLDPDGYHNNEPVDIHMPGCKGYYLFAVKDDEIYCSGGMDGVNTRQIYAILREMYKVSEKLMLISPEAGYRFLDWIDRREEPKSKILSVELDINGMMKQFMEDKEHEN